MIGLIALVLPIVIGIGISVIVGRKAYTAMKSTGESGAPWPPVLAKWVLVSGLLVVVIGALLAISFAGPTDTFDGKATWPELVWYFQFQAICLSVFLVPTLIMALLLGRQKDTQ